MTSPTITPGEPEIRDDESGLAHSREFAVPQTRPLPRSAAPSEMRRIERIDKYAIRIVRRARPGAPRYIARSPSTDRW
jgi:hypothetical protein